MAGEAGAHLLLHALRHGYEGRIRVRVWRFKVGQCCEYHALSVHVGPFIWRWAA